MRRIGLSISALGLVGAVTLPAEAITVSLDQCSAVGFCNELKVTTTLVGSAIDVDVTAANTFGIYGDTGTNRAFAFNMVGSGSGVGVSNLTPGFSFAGTNINVGGPFGAFEFVLNGPHRLDDATLPLHFRVTRTGGFTTDLQLFEANAHGFYFTAHVSKKGGKDFIGWASTDTPPLVTAIPEPASLILVGTGVAALVRRRIVRKRA